MQHTFANSSCLASASFNSADGLTLEFNHGAKYQYPRVTEAEYLDLVQRDSYGSPGQYFNDMIFGQSCQRIG